MPKFPDTPDLTLEDSIIQVISSIAMEELALSHILNAEGEKIQYVLGTLADTNTPFPSPTTDDLLGVNESVKDMLSTVSMNQMFLLGKLSAAMDAYSKLKAGANSGDGSGDDNELPVRKPAGGFTSITNPDPMLGDGYYADVYFPDLNDQNNKFYHDGSVHLEDIITDGDYDNVTATAVDPKYQQYITTGVDHCGKPSIIYSFFPSNDDWRNWGDTYHDSNITVPVQVVLERDGKTATVTINMIYPLCLVTLKD
jgi:hypothetical protein